MTKLTCLLALLLSFSGLSASPTSKPAEPRATFEKMWVDYDITEDGLKGMRLHVKFTAYDMKDMDSYLAIYFTKDDGTVLKDKNDKFESTAGDVALYKSIKPNYNPAVYNDLQVFMPYSELDLDPGSYNLVMDVKLIYKEGGLIQKLTSYDFEYDKPGTVTASGGAPASAVASAKFEDLWVDYDVTEGGKKGIKIHVKFRVYDMKGEEGYLAIYFEKKNGDKLRGKTSTFRSSSGQAAVYKSITPGYQEAVYDDLQVFMPYEEFSLGSGRFDLRMDASVIKKNGDLVKQMKYHEFWFKQ